MKHPSIRAAALSALLLASPLAAQAPAAGGDTVAGDTVEIFRRTGLVTREELFAARMRAWGIESPDPFPRRPTSRADSLAWVRARRAAQADARRRVVVSLYDRRLWLIEGADTLLSAPAGVGMGVVTVFGKRWDHSTPRGRRTVRARAEAPLWVPPDWHYVQEAGKRKLAHAQLPRRGVALDDGRRLEVRGSEVGTVEADGAFTPAPAGAFLVHRDTLWIPPVGTGARAIPQVLGAYKLDLGDGYLIHGTTEGLSIGFPSTHGCIRLDAADLERLWAGVPVGTPVYVY